MKIFGKSILIGKVKLYACLYTDRITNFRIKFSKIGSKDSHHLHRTFVVQFHNIVFLFDASKRNFNTIKEWAKHRREMRAL